MKFVSRWSYACANHLSSVLNENHQKRAVYYYGFFLVIGMLVKAVILISISALLGVLIPTLLIVFVFGSLRILAGGYHMDTYGKCLLASLGLFVISGAIAQYTFNYWNVACIAMLIVSAFIIGLYVLIRYAPRDTPNKPITDPKEIKKFKRLSIVYLFVWLAVVTALVTFELNLFAIALSFGVLLELFAITPTGHKFFDVIKAKLS